MADEEEDGRAFDNPAARLRYWLGEGQNTAATAAEDAQRVRNNGNRIPRTAPYKMLDCWCAIWNLDKDNHAQRVEYQRRATGMIEAGMNTRRLAEESTNFMAPHAIQHFGEVERALRFFMEGPGNDIGGMMGQITGTGWHSLEMLDELLKHEMPEPVLSAAQTTDLLAKARDLIDSLADSDLPDVESLVAHVREVETAILRFRINGTGDVVLATDGLVGSVIRLYHKGVDIKNHPVVKAAFGLAGAIFVILGAGADYAEIASSEVGVVLHLPDGASGNVAGTPSAGG